MYVCVHVCICVCVFMHVCEHQWYSAAYELTTGTLATPGTLLIIDNTYVGVSHRFGGGRKMVGFAPPVYSFIEHLYAYHTLTANLI